MSSRKKEVWRSRVLLWLVGGVWLLPWIAAGADSSFRWAANADQVTLFEADQAVFTFQLAPQSLDGKYPRANYLHPVWDWDQDVATEDFPADHVHHRGVFWAWHQLLWNGRPVADPWLCDRVTWSIPHGDEKSVATGLQERRAELRVVRDWEVPHPDGDGQTLRLVRETVRIESSAREAQARWIDFEIVLEALLDGVTLGGSDDDKGYGGFSPRLRLGEGVEFFGRQGRVEPQRSAVEGGPWVGLRQELFGREKRVVMMVHPSHPGFPLKWILRAKGSMQNPQWPGRTPVLLPKGRPERLRYRLLFCSDRFSEAQMEANWQSFARD